MNERNSAMPFTQKLKTYKKAHKSLIEPNKVIINEHAGIKQFEKVFTKEIDKFRLEATNE
jgi:hypothetical protein